MDKKKKIILGATAAAVALAIGAIAVTQGARLKTAASVARSATMSEEQTAAISDENAQITQDIQEQYQLPEITLTPEMEAAIADGSMTLEEAAAQLISGGAAQSETTDDAQASETTETTDNAQASETAESASGTAESAPTPEPSQPAEARTEEAPSAALSGGTDAAQTEQAPTTNNSQTEQAAADNEQTAQKPATDNGQAQKPATDNGQTAQKPATDNGQTQKPATDNGQTAQKPASDNAQTEQAASADSGRTQAPEKSEAEKAKEAADAKAQNLFAQLYVLKNAFNNKVDGIIGECIEEFLALDPSEQTKAAKLRIVYSRLDAIQAMEADCDAQVESIAVQLDEIDPALGEKARQYYQNEKELKKASLISQYGGQ